MIRLISEIYLGIVSWGVKIFEGINKGASRGKGEYLRKPEILFLNNAVIGHT